MITKLSSLKVSEQAFANLLKYKESTKVSVVIKFVKTLLTSCVLDSLTSMIECLKSNNTEYCQSILEAFKGNRGNIRRLN